jgi:hypothetical protein
LASERLSSSIPVQFKIALDGLSKQGFSGCTASYRNLLGYGDVTS